MGRQVPIRAGVGASDPHRGIALRSEQEAFRSPPAPLRIASEVNEYPMRVTSPTPAQESAHQAPRGQGFAPAGAPKGFPLALWKPSVRPLKQSSAHRAASPSPAPESARQTPPRGISYDKVVAYRCKQGGFPRGKQSACQSPSPKSTGAAIPRRPLRFFYPFAAFPFFFCSHSTTATIINTVTR